MKKKIYLVFIGIALISSILIVKNQLDHSVNNPKTIINSYNKDKNSKYDIYVDIGGEIGVVQVFSINENKIDYSNMNVIGLKKQGKTVDSIIEVEQNKVYASINSTDNHKVSNRVEVLEKGKVVKETIFDDKKGSSQMIYDKDNHKVFVMANLARIDVNPNGTPFGIIDSQNDKALNLPFYIKGAIQGYDTDGKNIYVNVVDADKCLYKDVPSRYIMKIDGKDSKVDIFTKNGIDVYARDLKIRGDYIYIISNGYFQGEKYIPEHKLSILNKKGEIVKNVALDPWANKILIDENGIAYINHRDLDTRLDMKGNSLTMFDTNNNKIIGKIDGFKGPNSMEIKDNYLFVSNATGKSISVIDLSTRKIIGEISLGGYSSLSTAIVKNP